MDRPLDEKLRALRDMLPTLVADRAAREVAGALLTDHAITAVREASTDDLAVDADHLTRFVTSRALDELRQADPEMVGWWFGLSRVLGLAERRVNRSAVEAILRSHDGKAQVVFAQVAAHVMATGEALARKVIDVAASESHRSHILRELEDADLVTRFKDGRETFVTLGGVGRDVARSQEPSATEPAPSAAPGDDAVARLRSVAPINTPVADAEQQHRSPASAFTLVAA